MHYNCLQWVCSIYQKLEIHPILQSLGFPIFSLMFTVCLLHARSCESFCRVLPYSSPTHSITSSLEVDARGGGQSPVILNLDWGYSLEHFHNKNYLLHPQGCQWQPTTLLFFFHMAEDWLLARKLWWLVLIVNLTSCGITQETSLQGVVRDYPVEVNWGVKILIDVINRITPFTGIED